MSKIIVLKKDKLAVIVEDNGSLFIEKRKFGSDKSYTISLSKDELRQIVEAIK